MRRRRERFFMVVAGGVCLSLMLARNAHYRSVLRTEGQRAVQPVDNSHFPELVLAFASGVVGLLSIGAVLLSLVLAAAALIFAVLAQRHRAAGNFAFSSDIFRLSSYDDRGREHMRRAKHQGLLSVAGFAIATVLFVVFKYLK
jgi:hypothetical protein